MRTTHWKALLLPLLLLSLHSVSVCLAIGCTFDEYIIQFDLQFNIATAAHQPTSQDWEPLRIVASARDLEYLPRYCTKKDGSIGDHSTKSNDSDCEDFLGAVNPSQRKILKVVLERAISLHTDRLLVQRATGPLVIPDLSTHPRCKLFNVPAEHSTTGVANADMVLYVGSIQNTDEFGAAVLGETCAKSASGRPIAGALFFGNVNIEISRHSVRLAAHHISHALGFSYDNINSRNITMNVVRSEINPLAVVTSDKTKKLAQEHYGCPTAEGIELEDGEENNETMSHWERRNAKDELMARPVGDLSSFMGFYTNFTLAVFEDMGFFKANFTMAEHMEYGYKTGCEFLNGKCMDKGKTKWPNMFCNVPESNRKTKFCITDRLGLGFCALKDDNTSPLPAHFQYFTSDKKGGYPFLLTDYCPVVEQLHPSFVCSNSVKELEMPGGLYGKNSMCLDASAVKVKTSNGAVPVAAVCAEISCEGNSVKVKYLGDKKWHDCPEGRSLTPSSTSKSFESGTIKCPKYKEVCTVASEGSSLAQGATKYKEIEPSPGRSPTASQGPKASREPTSSQIPTASQDPKASQKTTGKLNDSKSGGMSKDGSSVTFGLVFSVAILVLSFARFLIA